MVLSDALVEEIFQTLIKLPYAAVEQLIAKMRVEAGQNQVANSMPIVRQDENMVGKTLPPEITKFTRMPKDK